MNQLRPHKAIIRDIKSEAEGVKTYTLSIEGYRAVAGQFNMVGCPGTGEAPISLSAMAGGGTFMHTIKAVGRVTDFLDKFSAGDEVFVRGPYGRGWPLKKAEGKDLILIAGGVGLAPVRPVIHEVIKRRDSFGDVTVICGARNEKNMLFTDEFDMWGNSLALYLTVDEVAEAGAWKYNTGLVTGFLDKMKINAEKTLVFVCGPEIMMRFISRGLVMRGIEQANLYVSMERRMKCAVAHCGHCQHGGLFVCKDGPVFSYKEVRGLADGML